MASPAGHEPASRGTDVIGVDSQAHGIELRLIDTEVGRNATQCLREHAGSAAMEETHGLNGALIDWHRAFDETITYVGDLDIKVLNHGSLATRIDE